MDEVRGNATGGELIECHWNAAKAQSVIGRNIKEMVEIHAGKPQKQAEAIAESEARRTGRDNQPGMATAPNAGTPNRSRSVGDAWPGRRV